MEDVQIDNVRFDTLRKLVPGKREVVSESITAILRKSVEKYAYIYDSKPAGRTSVSGAQFE